MLYSYYFNIQKTHLLNCRFRVLQFTELEQGMNQIMFSAEIEEVKNGAIKKKETKTATFSFPPSTDETQHDIDFSRVRYAEQKKWLFTVINNKDSSQTLTVGIISDTLNRNPLGLDVWHNNQDFNAQLKGNNLSVLESSYKPPVLTQTLVNNTFNNPGYPERFSSVHSSYDSTYRHFTLSDFTQEFLESIPAHTPFKISMDIAPESVTPNEGYHIFHLDILNLGRVSLLTNGLEYKIHDGSISDIEKETFESNVNIADFWNNGVMTAKSRLTIEGDGSGQLSIRYFDKVIEGNYDSSKEFKEMSFKTVLDTREDTQEDIDENDPKNWIKVKLDNITVNYSK